MPALYLVAALIGSLVPVNRGWTEPEHGTTIYIADNGIHADIIMPVKARRAGLGAADPGARLRRRRPGRALDRVRIGRAASLSRTRRPGGTSRRARSGPALTGGKRVMHVEYVPSPAYAVRADPPAAGGISPACGPQFAPTSRSMRTAGRSASTIRVRPVRRVLPRQRQGERAPDLQQRSPPMAEARRGEGEPVAAIRQRTGLAISPDGRLD